MNRYITTLALLTAGLAGNLAAQNLLTNGDFEGKTLSPWTTTGFVVNPLLESADVNGDGVKSQCYSFTPQGGTQYPHKITQALVTKQGTYYQYSADIFLETKDPKEILLAHVHVAGVSRVGGGFSVSEKPVTIQGKLMTKFHVDAIGQVQKPSSAALFTLEITASSTKSQPSRVYVDDLDVRVARTPFIGNAYSHSIGTRSRMLGDTISLELFGTPGAASVTMIGFRTLPQRIALPGWSGDTPLDPSMIFSLGVNVFGPSNTTNPGLSKSNQNILIKAPKLASLLGVPIFYQSLELNTIMNVAGFGWETNLPFLQ